MRRRKNSNGMTMRTFIAIDIFPDERMVGAIGKVKDHFRGEAIRWVRMDPLHITIAFLGDTGIEAADLVCRLLCERVPGFGEFSVTVRGTGYFGPAGSPKVFWAGIEGGEKLLSLHRMIHQLLGDAGINPDKKPFRPHVTLGRIKSFTGRAGKDALPEQVRSGLLMRAPVREVVFYRSILGEQGAVYEPLCVAGLGG